MHKNMSLFDPPISRRSDPDTSKYAELRHSMSKRAIRQAQTLKLVGKYPGRTSGEYSRLMLAEYPELPVRCAVETPHKRLSDLEQKGLVKKFGQRICEDSGYQCLCYIVTPTGRALLTDLEYED